MERTLFSALVAAARMHGPTRVMLEDATPASLTYRRLITQVLAVGMVLKRLLAGDNNMAVGVMMPTSLGGTVGFFALQAIGRVPAMLNFTAGLQGVQAAVAMTQLHTVLTSRLFVAKAELGPLVEALATQVRVVYLEDVRPQMTLKEKISAALRGRFLWLMRRVEVGSGTPAVILFTSGSEGVPKGVALSHRNLLTNIDQVRQRLPLHAQDRLFNALPLFHSFGLTVGTLLPLLLGVRVFFYPSPLHYKAIPAAIREAGSTVMLGTDTFYKGYAHYAESADFVSLRLAIAGAEKLREETARLYRERFGLTLYQGYGVTEASPVLACNTPDAHRPGTVGRLFPGIEGRIEPVPGMIGSGRLLVRGGNIMLGYITSAAPGEIARHEAWYDTGDIVDLDADGFITIVGRAKRFAKIGGEMVSLAAVEDLASSAYPDHDHAAVAMPDERKGERVMLYTECEALIRDDLIRHATANGYSELCLPRTITYIATLPRLGNGKIDYLALRAI